VKRFLQRLRRSNAGVAAIEFAMAVPILVVVITGAVQLGMLFFANAGLNNALDEGARYATIYDTSAGTRPTTAQITTYLTSHEYGLASANITGPTYATGTSNGAKYLDITLTYSVPLHFVVVRVPAVTLTRTRRVFVY
jgi:Flp pilus assembly protein TadG